MEGEIVRMFHDPATMIGLLPFIDGLSGIDFHIINIAHGKGIEIDLHCCSLAESDRLVDKFCCHWKDRGYGLGAG